MRAIEFRDLSISAVVLAFAFGIAMSGGVEALGNFEFLLVVVAMAFFAVSTGFILHELAHRMVARRFGYHAYYAMWPTGLMIAVASSFMGFIFAAPGAVNIRPGSTTLPTQSQHKTNVGLISIAGPASNIALALVFIMLDNIFGHLIFSLGALINVWLAVFNLIPFGPLDGAKIFWWNKLYWGFAMAVAGGLFLAQRFLI